MSSAQAPDLIARRRRVLAPGYSLFYEQPLHAVRGAGVWLYDESGRAYLDAYNNVAHVGHCHPRVVEAISRQAATLNTNTRYLHELILRCAERISAHLPPGLDVCTFVCTGSEANDLAFQMARSFRGHSGALVSDYSYHGNTSLVSRLSTADYPVRGGTDFVRDVPAPDAYRGWLRGLDAASTRARVAARVDEVIVSLADEGHRPAALLLDSMFVSEGIFTAVPAYLNTLCERVRAAGGLFIADEVQGGFGRSGEHFWSFAWGDVVPDIVTLGKPMGNGHPVALVATTREIAGRFAEGPGYFNTFGGNPVACAAALAVLDVIEEEELQQRARDVGRYLRRGLDELATRHACIGDIRGAGMCIGVEIVADGKSPGPAMAQAQRIKNRMRLLGVLIGTTSRHDNVLKIRPPMVFNRANVDQLLETLDETLLGTGSRKKKAAR
jgi:4-aminobutyrate aminotransferase-like enzyme